MPAGLSTARTVRREGVDDLHWKVLGDGLVRFFQNSGPVLTKFGQVLATRHDVLPTAVCARLEALYSGQRAMPPRQLKRALRRAYGRSLPFEVFDEQPIGVGSIGQVHRARLSHGEPVVVKILRPGVEEQIERDLNLARVALSMFLGIPRRGQRATRALLTRSLDDLAQGYAKEVDLRNEAGSLRDFKVRFEKHANVAVPECYEDLSSKSVLVMEELIGEPLSEYRKRAGVDPQAAKRVADLALTEILRQIFEDGRFHADPHGGNLLILQDGRLGIIDLGLTGEFSQKDRKNMARAVRAFLSRDVEGLIRALLDFGTTPTDLDLQKLQQDVIEVVGKNKKELVSRLGGEEGRGSAHPSSNSLKAFVTELFRVAHAHGIYFPPSTTLFIKTLVTIEGVARSLDPEINLVTTGLSVVLRSLSPRWMRWMFGLRIGSSSGIPGADDGLSVK